MCKVCSSIFFVKINNPTVKLRMFPMTACTHTPDHCCIIKTTMVDLPADFTFGSIDEEHKSLFYVKTELAENKWQKDSYQNDVKAKYTR